LAVNQPVTSTGAPPLITLACDCQLTSTLFGSMTPVVFQAPGGTIEYGPDTNGFNQTVQSPFTTAFNASLLRYGLSHDPINNTQTLDGSLVLGSAAGPIVFSRKNLEVDALGGITQFPGSSLTGVGTLTGTAGSASIASTANTIASLGAFFTTGAFSLGNAQALTVTGTVSAGTSLTLTLAGPLALGAPTTPGTLTSPGTVNLTVTAITEPNGGITAAMLTGNGGASAVLNGRNRVNALGAFTTNPGSFVLNDLVPLVIDGPLSANLINIQAPGSITLAGDVATAAATSGGATFVVGPDLSGNATFAQTGTSNIAPLGSGNAAVEVDTNQAQTSLVAFNNLVGPHADLVLQLGNGVASGTVDAGSLFVHGAGGSAVFFKSVVSGQSGPAAAAAARYGLPGNMTPSQNPAYQMNDCTIGATVCSPVHVTSTIMGTRTDNILQANPVGGQAVATVSIGVSNIVSSLIDSVAAGAPQTSQQIDLRGVPLVNPMRDLANGPLRDQQADPDLLLPNVSEKDY